MTLFHQVNIDEMKGIIEGLLFVAGDDGLSDKQLAAILNLEIGEIRDVMQQLKEDYHQVHRGLQLVEISGTYQLTTKPEHLPYFQYLMETPIQTGLSQAALETLAIIAYKQPITRVEIEEIRGVKTEKPIQTLISKLLIKEVGRAEGSGRAILYGTTKDFLDHFGLKSIIDLPPLPEGVGEGAIEEDTDLFFKKFEENIGNLPEIDNS